MRFGLETALSCVWSCSIDGENIHIYPPGLMRMQASTQIVPLRKWQAPSWTPNDLTTNFTLSSFACIYTQTESDWPYKCPASFSSRFQPKINRFLEENGCKTLSLLSSPFVQSHFKAITGNNRNNQTFIPCKTRSSPQNKLFILQQQKWVTPHQQEGQSWFCFTICRQKNKIISYFGRYHKCLSRRITFGIQHISFIWGGKVVPLSWSSPERFLSCQAYKMSQNAPAEKYKSNDDFPN